ncbi:hypothetical protein H8959_020041, partial [Pygathrix nigripes]
MFKNEYQGGAFVEIFSAQGKNPGAKWKILGSPSVIWKEFDKEVKSFVFVLEGSSQTNKIQLPKENKQILGLIQRFLVLQIYVPLGQDFSTELLSSTNDHPLTPRTYRFYYTAFQLLYYSIELSSVACIRMLLT